MRNLKLAFRMLAKTPFVTAVAVLSLALGIGANTAVFSLFEQMLLRTLPVAEPERLVTLAIDGDRSGAYYCGVGGSCDGAFSYPMLRDLQEARTEFTGVAGYHLLTANLAFGGRTMNGNAVTVSGSYFPVLGIRPAIGRLLGPGDDETIGGHPVAVLSHAYWESSLGGDPAVVGKTLIVNGHPMAVVGVAPRGFHGATLGVQPEVFVPLSMISRVSPTMMGAEGIDQNRKYFWIYVLARLKPGATMESAQRAVNAAIRPIITDVEAPLQVEMDAEALAAFRRNRIVLADGSAGQSIMHGQVQLPLLLLFSVSGIVLLIACANIANLLLVRGAGRSMEMAVRLSLGATRRQVVGQLLIESMVLAALGGIASLLVARWTLAGIAALLPPQTAEMLELGIRWPVALFAAGIALLVGLVFGLFPALQSTRSDLVTSIRANAGQIAGARASARFRTVLVTAQIALSVVLLVSAGLFLRSLGNVSGVQLGIRSENLIAFTISPALNGYEKERTKALFDRAEEELEAIPGVAAVTSASVRLLSGGGMGTGGVNVEGHERVDGADYNTGMNMVGPDYFRTMGIPLLRGRDISQADRPGAPVVAVVNEAFAERFGLGAQAVGRRFTPWGGDDYYMEIVGVTADAKSMNVKDETVPQIFVAHRQDPNVGSVTFYIRSQGDPAPLMKRIPSVMAAIDPNLPLERLRLMESEISDNVYIDRLISALSAAFAVLATVLACIGLYGVLAYTVAQRTREIGVRMALGADARRVRALILRQVGVMVAVGVAVGLIGAFAVGRAVQSLLYGLEPLDPLVLLGSVAALSAVAFGAAYLPALRASRINPMQALRYE